MELSKETVNAVEVLTRRRLARSDERRPITQTMLTDAVSSIVRRLEARDSRRPIPSISKMIRGLMAIKRRPISHATAESDAEFVKALSPTTTPGSYLVPVETAHEVTELLAQYETMRVAGCRVWPMVGISELRVGSALTNPSFNWTAANSRVAPTDNNFGQLSFSLETLEALVLVSAQLFKVTRPEFDLLLADTWAMGIADAADAALHAPATLSGDAPTAFMSASGITVMTVGNSPNGGNLAYSDLLAVLQKAADLKIRGGCWFMNGRSWLRVLGLQSTTSQPLVTIHQAMPPMAGFLLGYPVFLTASILSTESVGSGSAQSHIVFCPARSVHMAESGEIEIAVSDEFAFDANEVAIRVIRRCDFGYAPSASIITLQGVN